MPIDMGQKIRQLRLQKEWKQKDLADRLGVNESTVSLYENYMRIPPYEILIKLCYIFGLSADYFLGIDLDNKIRTPLQDLSESQVRAVLTVIDEFRLSNMDR